MKIVTTTAKTGLALLFIGLICTPGCFGQSVGELGYLSGARAPHVDAVKQAHPLRLELPMLAAAESIDYGSTASFDWRYDHETNPILGTHPGSARIAAFGAAEFGAWSWTLSRTEKSTNPIVRWSARAALAAQLTIHIRYGIRNIEIQSDPVQKLPPVHRRF